MGFLLGSLALIALEVLVGTSASGQIGAGITTSASLFRRVLSPDVAGVPDRSHTTQATAEPPAAPSLGGPRIPIPNP